MRSAAARARQAGALATAAAGTLLLAGCGASSTVELGEKQDLGIRVDDVDSRVLLSVDQIRSMPVADSGLEFDAEYNDGTMFYVDYSVQKTEGTYSADNTYSFSHYQWDARQRGGDWATTVNVFMDVPQECPAFRTEEAEALDAGKTVTACQMFLSTEPDAELERVTWDRPALSYKNRDKGNSWTVPED